MFLQWQIQVQLIGNVRMGRKQVEYYFFLVSSKWREDMCVYVLFTLFLLFVCQSQSEQIKKVTLKYVNELCFLA